MKLKDLLEVTPTNQKIRISNEEEILFEGSVGKVYDIANHIIATKDLIDSEDMEAEVLLITALRDSKLSVLI